LSGALPGTSITRPSPVAVVFNVAPLASNFADRMSFFKPGMVNLPSLGQSKTEKYNMVLAPFSFLVQRPQANNPKGLAFVPYIASPFTFIQAPMFFNMSILSCGKVPSDLGPTFNK